MADLLGQIFGPHQIMVEICTNVRRLAYSTADNLRASSQIQTVSR